MPGLDAFLWGAPAALAAAFLAFAVALQISRCAAVAWHAGVILGLAAGAVALAAHGCGWTLACQRLVLPIEAHGRLPLVALAAAVPAVAARALGRPWAHWLLAAPLAALAPLWLLWGGRFLPKQEVRDAGFADHAWSPAVAVAILAAVALATLAVWRLWRAVEPASQPLLRTTLTAAALGGAGATVACTGSITYGQALALLALVVAACGALAWLMRSAAGPERAAGPILLVVASLLVLAVGYSELKLWQAIALAALIAISAGWLPVAPGRPRLAAVIRTGLVLIPLTIIAGAAAAKLAASQRPMAPTTEADLYS